MFQADQKQSGDLAMNQAKWGEPLPLQLKVGDVVRLRKPHPCGSTDWKIMRTGMDFRIQCLGCQHQAWITRVKLERQIKQILQQENH